MKILHLIDSGGLYGAEKMLVSLAVQQQRLGADVVIGSIRKPGLGEKLVEQEARGRGVTVVEFEMKHGVNIFGALRILRYAIHSKVELIHSHGYKTNILLGFLPVKIRRIPIVSTLHGWTSSGKWTKMYFNELLDSLALRFVERIVLVNKGMLSKPAIQKLPRHKIDIVDNGIDLLLNYESSGESGDVLAKTVEDFCREGVVVASIGRLSPEKGYSYLIEGVASVRNTTGMDVRLLLVGDGRLRDKLQKQAKEAGIARSFLITGYIANARKLIPLADVYALSSLTEGLPISLLEAMTSGIPIVATAVGGVPHVVEHEKSALLVAPANASALQSAIEKLIHDPELGREFASRAKKEVEQRHSSEIMAEKYNAIYAEVVFD